MRLFHIVDRRTWDAAVAAGEYVPERFAADGFVHLCFADQVARVANARYRDLPDPVVVELDPAVLDVVVEPGDDTEELFPHVYRPIPTAAAVARHALTRDCAGGWVFSPGGGPAGPASPGR